MAKLKKITVLMMVLVLILFFAGNTLADATNIWILKAFPSEAVGTMDVYFQATDANNNFVSVEKEKLSFQADNGVTLNNVLNVTTTEGISYIFVADLSGCYFQADNESVSAALSAMVNGMRSQDNAYFVTVTKSTVENAGYMTSTKAREYVGSLKFNTKKGQQTSEIQAPLWDGINAAGVQASLTGETSKPIKVVVIFTDGVDNEKGKTVEQVLSVFGNCKGTPVYSFVAVGTGESTDNFIKNSSIKTREGLQRLKNQNGGNYFAVNSAVMGEGYAAQAIREIQSILCATVDIVPLHASGDKEYPLTLIYNGSGRKISAAASVKINRAAIPSPTPEPVVRKPDVQFTWEELEQQPADLNAIQTALFNGNYLASRSGEVDTQTKQALFDFCSENKCKNLNEGISTEAWKLIQSGKAKAKPTPTPVPKATRDPEIVFSLDDGFETPRQTVTLIQDNLKKLYYLDESDYRAEYATVGTATMAAMNAFCADNQLTDSRGFTKKAFDLLTGGNASAKKTPEPVVEEVVTPTPIPTLKPGLVLQLDAYANNSGTVIQVQNQLELLGYLSGNYKNGVYDASTHQAVLNFCKKNGVEESNDGLTEKAYKLLVSENARAAETPTPAPTPIPTLKPGLALQLDAFANNSGTVIQVQNQLELLGYLTGNYEKGTYDANTHQAVLKFCKKNGLAESNDGLEEEAYKLLISDQAKPWQEAAPTTAAPTAHPFAPDMEESTIAEYQNRLNELGYYEGRPFIPGRFDEATQAAQDRFCEVNNIEKQSGASVELQQTVRGSAAKHNVQRPLLERVRIRLTGRTEIVGLVIPTWSLVAVIAILTITAIVLIVLLLKPARKPSEQQEGKLSSQNDILPQGQILPGSLEETVDMSGGNDRLDMTVVGESQNITLRIDYNGTSTDKAYELSEGMPLVIGRGTEADIRTNKDDMRISRKHGTFSYRNGGVYYRDTSKAGTMIDGQMIHEDEVEIHSGATIHISNHVIKIQM